MSMQKLTCFSRSFFLLLLVLTSLTFGASPDPVRGSKGMVVSASDLASQVSTLMLKRGGNAVDAAVAAGFTLAVTYPSAGNLGGGGYMVIHLSDGRDIALDYREKAPLRAARDMYLDSAGNVIPERSTLGFPSAGVPGSVAGLIYALEKFGTMKLAEVIQPAIDIAEDGFPLSYRQAKMISDYLPGLRKFKSTEAVFTKNGTPYNEGDIFKQPDLAKTLRLIKEKGRDGFYKGETADLLLKQSDAMGGFMSRADLEGYEVIEKVPVRGTYRGYEIISMPPSSSGGTALIEALNVLENFNFKKEDWNSSRYLNKLVETLKHVYADRAKHLGDEAFYPVPRAWLTSKQYAHTIFDSLKEKAVPSKDIFAGQPVPKESPQTTHYSVADSYGNAVSTTTTLNSTFGSKLVVEGAGFLLNNEMDDFSAKPGQPNQFGLVGSDANSIAPGKRMLSSMTPTIILKDRRPVMVIGSPGGSMIITTVLQVIMNCLDFGMNMQQAIDAPRFHHQWLPDEINYEEYGLTADVMDNLKSMGYILGTQKEIGLAEGIMLDYSNNIMYGATDPRGFGRAVGF